jgi:hypothetical protein
LQLIIGRRIQILKIWWTSHRLYFNLQVWIDLKHVEFTCYCVDFMKINSNMLEIPIIRKPLDNHIEFEWKFKFWIMKVCVSMVAIPPMWWPLNQFRHLHHVEFYVKFSFFWKINEVTWKFGWNTSYLVATRWVLFSSLLSLVSNSGFYWKFMQLHENMVEIHHIWWPLGFVP